MRHTLLLAASAATLMAAPALAQEQQPAPTEQPAVEGATETQAVTTTSEAGGTGGGDALRTLSLAAEQLQTVAQQIQGAAAGTVGTTDGATGGIATGTTDGTTTTTTDGTTTTTIDGTTTATAGVDMEQMQQQATQALDQFDQAVQQVSASPEGQPAQQQIALLQEQSQQVRQQLEQDPQVAAGGMQELAQAALQLQTAQIPADARSIIGKQLVSSDGEEAGEVRDVLITPDGQVNALVMERGGALGLGGQQVAIQWAQVQIQGDQLTVNMTSDQIDQMPEYQVD